MAQIALSRDAGKFVAELSRLTGLNSRVLAAQLYAEEGSRRRPAGHEGDQNWLNVGNTDSKWYKTGGKFSTPEQAARTTAGWISGKNVLPNFGRAAPGIQAILKAGASPQAQISAIARSGWATDPGYGDTIRSLYGQIGHYKSNASSAPADAGSVAPRAVTAPETQVISSPLPDSSGSALAEMLKAQGVGVPQQAAVSGSPLQAPAFAAGAVLPNTQVKAQAASLSSPAQAPEGTGKFDVQTWLGAIPQADASLPTVSSTVSASKLIEQAGGVPASRQVPGAPRAGQGRADRAVAWAESRIGHYAENQGSDRGDELDALQARFGMRGEAWCSMFATTAAAQGGMPRSGRSASVAQVREWAGSGQNGYSKLVNGAHAGPGDLLMWGNDHIAFVVSNHNGTLKLIQGNGSSGKVDRRTVSASEAAGLQAARPKYRRRG